MSYARRVRVFSTLAGVVVCATLLCRASLASARGPETAPSAPRAPVAVLVDGVKVGSTDRLAVAPKRERRGAGSGSCSRCTLMLTY